MNIYVASKFENKEVVREVHAALLRRGHSITHDWTHESVEGKEGAELLRYFRSCAEDDVEGVRECDVFFLINHLHGSGMWIEFGLALAWGKKIVVAHEQFLPEPIFMRLPSVRIARSISEAVEIIETMRLEAQAVRV